MHTMPNTPLHHVEDSLTPAAATVIKYRFVAYLVILVIALTLILAENRAYRSTDPAERPAAGSRPAQEPVRPPVRAGDAAQVPAAR